MKTKLGFCAGIALFVSCHASGQETSPVDYSVQIHAEIQTSPSQITLVWPKGRWDTSYVVSRKQLHERTWNLAKEFPTPASLNRFADTDVIVGEGYEYQIRKTTSRGFIGWGYIYAGAELPLIENRGTLILLVDSPHASPLSSELSRLTQDLVGDGWRVLRVNVPSDAAVHDVRAIIKGLYDLDPASVKALFLFGHIPVALSGNIAPDDHNHEGAWPADVYYADVNGRWQWTDFSVASLTAQVGITRNVPGDRKFDQSYPAAVDLDTGRVDFWNMPVFASRRRPEVEMLRQYLNKNHRFRHGQVQVPRRGLIADFLPKGYVAATTSGDADPVGNSAWRNFSAFFGAENIAEAGLDQYFPTATSQSFLWSFAASSSRLFDGSEGIGTSTDFAEKNVQVVFTMFVGGWYGDWNWENNFLRAALGSGHVLTASYSGLPHWLYQHMAMGTHIGFSARLTQSNRRGGLYPPFNDGAGQVHIGLMGDPSLRMHPVIPPSNLTASQSGGAVTLNWTPSSEQNLRGYMIYRASSPHGPFERISGGAPIIQTTFADQPPSAPQTYMVRSIKLEQSASGSYFNASQGTFVTVGEAAPPSVPSNVKVTALSASQLLLSWNDDVHNERGIEIERKSGTADFTRIATMQPDVTAFFDRGLAPETTYAYRLRALNDSGASPYSAEVQGSTLVSAPSRAEPKARFVKTDAQTQGTWPGVYGKDGYYAVTKEDSVAHAAESPWPADPKVPYYAGLNPVGRQTFIWQNPTSDPRALFEADDGLKRIAAAWYAEKFSIELTFKDALMHRVSFYFLDWDNMGRSQRVEILGANGQLLDSRTASGFQDGVYFTWDLQGPVRVDFTTVAGPNAVLMGFFFDPAGGMIGSPPAAPSNLAATAVASSEVRLAWSDNSNDESGFRVERRRIDEQDFGIIATLPADGVNHDDSGLAPATEYVYRITAFNGHGASGPSNVAQVRTLTPVGVSIGIVRASSTQVRLRVTGTSGTRISVESSDDLELWETVTSAALTTSAFELEQAIADAQRFFRARAD